LARALRLHQRDDGRAVDAARQQRTQRHVRYHLPTDGIAQQRVEAVARLLVVHLMTLRRAAPRRLERVPIARDYRLLPPGHLQEAAGRQLVDALVDCVRRGDVAELEIAAQGVAVDA